VKLYIAIEIRDENVFFIQGLQKLLLHHFSVKGYVVHFISIASRIRADLLIQGRIAGRSLPFCPPMLSGRMAVITVRDSWTQMSRFGLSACQRQRGVISRRDTPSVVMSVVDQAMMLQTAARGSASTRCEHCTLMLTPREREVLHCIAEGMAPYRVGKTLDIAFRTVSTHKRAAMRKLGFQSNHELYYWLRQGGLDINERASS
jgi:DNA-binding CsgD family transcriptional regulator